MVCHGSLYRGFVRKRQKLSVTEKARHRLSHMRDQAVAAERQHAINIGFVKPAVIDRILQAQRKVNNHHERN
jgi:hypothetical protein